MKKMKSLVSFLNSLSFSTSLLPLFLIIWFVVVKYIAKDENGVVVSKCDEGLEFSLTNGELL